ncbi:MAG: FkbM family methyltransferase, partial [Clostridia bacterium]|nr:FkbM family methyltransferase [Clostridia bacterium]
LKVLSYKEMTEKFGENITVLLSFGTNRPEVLSFISELDKKHELIIPDVPLYGGNLFDREYFLTNEKRIIQTINLFEDDISQRLFVDVINFRLTGKLRYLNLCESIEVSLGSLLKDRSVGTIVDGGAYKGDTARIFLSVFEDTEKLYAVEPDPGSYSKLSELKDKRIQPVNAALSASSGITSFFSSSSRGASVSGVSKRSRSITVETTTIDKLLSGNACDIVKLDVEGNEKEALLGAKNTIVGFSPNLIISLYHRTDDLIEIPRMIKSISDSYALFLRRPFCVPMWDLNLFAVKRS